MIKWSTRAIVVFWRKEKEKDICSDLDLCVCWPSAGFNGIYEICNEASFLTRTISPQGHHRLKIFVPQKQQQLVGCFSIFPKSSNLGQIWVARVRFNLGDELPQFKLSNKESSWTSLRARSWTTLAIWRPSSRLAAFETPRPESQKTQDQMPWSEFSWRLK